MMLLYNIIYIHIHIYIYIYIYVHNSLLSDIIHIEASNGRSFFLKKDSTVWVIGKFGNQSTSLRSTPVQINTLSGIIAIDASGSHSLFKE